MKELNLHISTLHFSSGWESFFSPRHPDRIWGPPSLLSKKY